MSQSSTPAVTDAIYDASSLGRPRMFVLGLQHMFAMFGATVLVPVLTGLSVSTTLLFAGIGTLLFHFLSRGKVPAFLGSSFAFIAGYAAIAPNGEAELLPYACLGVACAGLLYPVLAALFRAFGAKRVMRFFPPVVTGPIVISIGLILASSAIANCQTNWLVAVIAVAVIIICNIWGRGMVKIVPILLGVVVSYAVAAALGEVDFSGVAAAPWVGLPVVWDNTVFALFGPQFDSGLATTAIITIMPLAFATMIEHIGDISAIGSTCERNYIGIALWRSRQYDVWREHRRACPDARVRPARDSHCRLLRHRAFVLPQVCCCDRCYAGVCNRRRVARALRHDQRRGRSQPYRKPG